MTAPADAIDGTTDDVFHADAPGGPLHVLQPRDGLRAGLDAVMLAACVKPVAGLEVLDAGAGAGVVGLCVARRCPWSRVTLVEREPELAELARLNARRNGLSDRVRVIEGDLTAPRARLAELGLVTESFDHVLANPPFHEAGSVRSSPRSLKASASVLGEGDLERWMRFLAAMARPGGHMTVIHRADALRDVLDAIGTRFGGLRVLPLHPRHGEPAVRVIVRGRKGSRAPLALLPGLMLHEGYDHAPEARRVLRTGSGIDHLLE